MTTVPLQLLGVTTMCGALSWKLPTLDLYRVWVHQGKVLTSSAWRGGLPIGNKSSGDNPAPFQYSIDLPENCSQFFFFSGQCQSTLQSPCVPLAGKIGWGNLDQGD